MSVSREIESAMYADDIDGLDEIAGCVCCCADHTFTTGCPTYQWGGCRGQDSLTPADYRAWEEHYAKHHGLTRDQFYGQED